MQPAKLTRSWSVANIRAKGILAVIGQTISHYYLKLHRQVPLTNSCPRERDANALRRRARSAGGTLSQLVARAEYAKLQ